MAIDVGEIKKTVRVLYLMQTHPLYNSKLREQVTNIVTAKPSGENYGTAELDESRGWKVVEVETNLAPKEIIDGYWLDIIDGEDEGQLLELDENDKTTKIMENREILQDAIDVATGSKTIEEVIKAVAEGKQIAIDGKSVEVDLEPTG